MYLSMQDPYYTFTMFDAQAFYARDVALGRIELPDAATMATDIAAWRERLVSCSSPSDDIDFQTDYVRELMTHTDYASFDLEMAREHFETWEAHKVESITGYRDQAFVSPCPGTQAPLHP